MDNPATNQPGIMRIKTGISRKRLRAWREYATGYLMIAPSVILIFIFGIFPVGFALYVSMQKWRLKRGDFLGLSNYTAAIGNLAYFMVFVIGIGALVLAFIQFQKIHKDMKVKPGLFWLLNLPGLLIAAFTLSFIRWTIILLPNILDIAGKITGVEKTRQLFVQLLHEAATVPAVLQARSQMLIILAAAVIIMAASWYFWRDPQNLQSQFRLASAWLAAGTGVIVLYFVYSQVMAVYSASVETGVDPGILPQLISISSGVILLFIGWLVWNRAKDQNSMLLFFMRLLAAMVFMVGGWIMIGVIPTIVASGDKDLWVGLRATVFYSLGTVPFQLGISLFLAILLFQNLKGSQFFRMMFFLPYVTPTVASAAVFRQLFSNRLQAPVNSILRFLGFEPLQWLWEPKGIFQLIATKFGIETWPTWANGPSLALVAIMLYSIWVFVGYDTVIYLAGLGNISKDMSEAAEVDGANKWQIFRYITFPLLSPTTYFLTLISIIGTFKAFNHIWVMRLDAALQTTDTFSVVIFSEFFEKLRYGYASAMAFVLFAIILCLTLINNKIQGSRVFYG
ncbi:MAG TPA: ABC transporter permease subunit [Anaerolineales bacterium]|nr:ABC transporter permease subunit [Anaerolineales bacterium]